MWSAGCIVRSCCSAALFQGTDPLNQLEQVVQLIGRPSEADLENVMNESALQFLENLPQSEAQLEETLSMASASAIELIRGMLRFNPETRISADEALRHPYLEEYAPDTATADAAAREELAPALLSEWLTITGLSTLPMEQLQNLIFREILHFHPEATTSRWARAVLTRREERRWEAVGEPGRVLTLSVRIVVRTFGLLSCVRTMHPCYGHVL